MATLRVPASVPSANEDSEQLRKAFQGWGTNEALIISILAHRNAHQRKLIREAYKATYGEDLLKDFIWTRSSPVTWRFSTLMRLVHLWTLDPPERDVCLANEACNKFTSSNQVLVEIACAKPSEGLLQVRRTYHCLFKKSLEEDVAHHTNGDFRKLLVPLVSAYRYEGLEVDTSLASSEAKILHQKIQDKAYSDEEVIRILSTRSKAQLSATFDYYKNEYGTSINKDLNADPKDDFLSLMRATIKCLTCPEKYFEKLLRLSINRMGTDENSLTRVVTTRAEVDMVRIKEEFQRRNNSIPLDRAIAKDTSGDYEKMLLALLGHGEA